MEFMADIEAMFHQVHIPKKERTCLWWEDVNLEKLIDYEICVHVFDGTSFSGCCIHSFQITPLNNVQQRSN